MSTDKTLADVQPGGRVRLGDQALSTSEGARRYVADFFATEMRRHDFGDYILTELAADFACALAQHLSAQPSPGGQGDARLLADVDERIATAKALGYEDDIGVGIGLLQCVRSALAARQPVGYEEQPYNSGGIELTACQLHEALLMAGDPELDVPFEDRSLVRIFWTETGHSGPGLYCECVGAEEEGCILLDGTAPAIGEPAQAVDLGRWSQRHADDLHVAVHTALSVHAGSLSQKKRAAISAYVKRLLIDSQAVGNG